MKPLLHAGAAAAFCAFVTGCAVPGSSPVTGAAMTPASTISADVARDTITVGKSTKADVMAALGKTTVISFDSGFEVWVYYVKDDTPAKPGWEGLFGHNVAEKRARGNTEFVVLFAPSGVVTKTRIRPVPLPGGVKRT